ncbi:MAG: MFS transporter [Gammaproteobacteria bacterium]|nr:MFS transporter [Gammaproteobacteria bacterium]
MDTSTIKSNVIDLNPMEDKPQSALKSWFALLSVAIGAFALVTSEFLPVGLLSDIATDLNISVGTAGLMVTAPGVIAAFAAPLVTVGVGKIDRRYLLWALTLLMIISNLIATFSNNFTILLIGRLLLGLGIGGFWSIAVALSGRLAPPGVEMGRASSVIFTGVTLATILGVPLGAWIGSEFGWRSSFAITGLLGAVVLVGQLLMLPALPATTAVKMRDLPVLFQHKYARIGLLGIVLLVLAHFSTYTYVTPFLKHNAGFDGNLISTLLLVYGVAGVVGNVIAGWATSRNIRWSFMAVVTLIGAAMILFPIFAGHLTGAVLTIALWGLAFGAMPTCANMWMFAAVPEAMEGGAAMLVSTFQVGIAVGSLLGGSIVDHFNIPSIMWVGGLLAIMSLLSLSIWGRGLPNTVGTTAPNSAH